ncbi:MAG: cytochrome c biogenesis protein CcdA [Armatimonadota bacterium]|nr:cytochrome c biogenesis protein CcdA [Armatimonadota bacterium]
MSALTLPAVLTGGLIDGLNPCAFSVLLSFVALILTSVALTSDPRPHLWRAGATYIAGMFLTYLLLGLGVIAAVSFFTNTHLPIRLMGFAVVVTGLWAPKDVVLPGVGVPLAMPGRWHGAVPQALSRTTLVGLFTAGALIGLCALPCSGAIYLGVLALIAREPLPARLGYVMLYNIMFVAPLVVLLATVASRRVLNRVAHAYLQRKALAKAAVGAVTVLLGLAILITA